MLAVVVPLVLIVGGGLAVYLGGKSSANGTAKDYSAELGDWQDAQVKKSEGLTEASSFSKKVSSTTVATSSQATDQKQACDKIDKAAKDSEVGIEDPPKLSDHTFSSFSDTYAKAEKRGSTVRKKVDDLRKDKKKLLADMAAECAFYNEMQTIERGRLEATAETIRRLDPRGSISPGSGGCRAIQGCIPATGARLAAYVSALERARVAPAEALVKLAESDVCKKSSFSPACGAQATYNRALVPVEKTYVATLRSATNTAGNSLVAAAIVRRSTEFRRLTATYVSAYRSAFPGTNLFTSNYEVKREQDAMTEIEKKLTAVDKKVEDL